MGHDPRSALRCQSRRRLAARVAACCVAGLVALTLASFPAAAPASASPPVPLDPLAHDPLGSSFSGLAVFGHDLWLSAGQYYIGEVDMLTGKGVTTISSGFGWSMEAPETMAVIGQDLFVGDGTLPEVVEVNMATGQVLGTLTFVPSWGYGPGAMVADGHELFVSDNDELDEFTPSALQSTASADPDLGTLIRQLTGARYHFADSDAMVLSGDDIFVANWDSNSVTEVNASTGALVRVFSAPRYQFHGPAGVAVAGGYLFVLNGSGRRTITQLNLATGAFVRVLSRPAYRLNDPVAMAVIGPDVFISNAAGQGGGASPPPGWVTEVDAATGKVVGTISGPSYGLGCTPAQACYPGPMVVSANDLFVSTGYSAIILACRSRSKTEAVTCSFVKALDGPADADIVLPAGQVAEPGPDALSLLGSRLR